MTQTILTAVRLMARSRNPAIRFAKRAATAILHRADIVARAHLNTGDVLYVDLGNTVGRTIWLRGDYSAEEPVVNLITSNLRASDVFFDVGANVGFFSLTAARIVGASGQVHSFEPLPKLADLLRKTVVANALTNMTVVEAVVGKTEGVSSIAAMPDSAYSHVMEGARSIDESHGGWKRIVVKSVALDDYVERIVGRLPRLIKMDIEGFEMEAIDGAQRMLSHANGPDVICEVGHPHLARFGHMPAELFGRFSAMGYTAVNPKTGLEMRLADLSVHDYNVFFKKIHT
jgi:FkbM family methyltransferase